MAASKMRMRRIFREFLGLVIGAPTLYGAYAGLAKEWPADAMIRYQNLHWGGSYPISTGLVCLVAGAILTLLLLLLLLPAINKLT